MYLRLIILYFTVFILSSCGSKKPSDSIMVFCASSLMPVMEQMKDKWEIDHVEKIIINSASSGTLARQIENGAQADIFLSANQDWMKYLVQRNKLVHLPRTIASNSLAVVAPIESGMDSVDFIDLNLPEQKGNFSIADPGHVPLGKYTKESMEFYDIYNQLTTRLILTKDARSTLRLVELGEVSMGFVYLSDAKLSTKTRIISIIPEESHQAISYQAIIVNESNPGSACLLDFLSSDENIHIWKKMGF